MKNPTTENVLQVHTTTDYFLFKSIDGNRTLNPMHINKLKRSMKENYLFTVIIVNEKYEIIDGQHRFEAIKELKLPLNYIICKGYRLHEVHVLNQIAKKWNTDDYLAGYCDLGYEHYLLYARFKEKYQFGHNECIAILSGVNSYNVQDFYKGDFKVKNYEQACKTADAIYMVQPYYKRFKRRSFIFALLRLFKNPNFEFNELLKKLSIQPNALVDCSNIEQYVSLIEEIYNYRRSNKVNLRF
jgi:hypothetical protein